MRAGVRAHAQRGELGSQEVILVLGARSVKTRRVTVRHGPRTVSKILFKEDA